MNRLTKSLVTLVAASMLTASAFAQTAKEANGLTPFIPVGQEPPAKLIVDPPIPLALAYGSALIQYRAENVRISPVFGPAPLNVFPRVGHLHINVDDLPWHWADASNTGTIDIKDLPPGQHKVTIDLVDANHQLFPGQSITMPQTSETH
jgi:hypothetical protein